MPGDGTLDACRVASTDAAQLTGRINALDAGALVSIGIDIGMSTLQLQGAAERLSEFHIRQQAIADRELIADNMFNSAWTVHIDSMQFGFAVSATYDAATAIGHTGKLGS